MGCGQSKAWSAEQLPDLTGKARPCIRRGSVYRAQSQPPLRCSVCFAVRSLTRSHAAAAPHAAQTALITGSNTGIGYEMAAALAAHGAHVLVASRNKSRVDAAVQKLKAAHPSASVSGYTLDLAAFRCAERACGTSVSHVLAQW